MAARNGLLDARRPAQGLLDFLKCAPREFLDVTIYVQSTHDFAAKTYMS
jgi:hypothetical protein